MNNMKNIKNLNNNGVTQINNITNINIHIYIKLMVIIPLIKQLAI